MSSTESNNVKSGQDSKYQRNFGAHIPGIQNQQVVDYYNQWAKNYDGDLDSSVYRGPQVAADLCNIFIPDKNLRIIDIGAGTGFCGYFLKQHGFTQIDAIDPSASMIEIARSKNIYQNLFVEGISGDQKTSIETGTYDVGVLSGAFGEGHIPCEGVREIARLVKPNGYIILVMRKEYLSYVKEYENKLEPLMNGMVDEGVWSKHACFEVENYSFDKTGLIYVFKKN
ncbi:Williams-Beuren syndrome chromosomal region 27 -like isoform X2 [Brachionus plicatilis]|uniref:Williams-Beuren syndrome chromosomal region 27-like isoform X2 n=1 Tax=Brachionus plicatilis TaxID=10195 RepID=A0A3M7RTY9_BRAPC|nr:Williams-Beuren syndrome chromosomal region 27 -like isoform X2 [Brachionus plicatilis]